jgi:aminopeptidase YwaD
MSPIMNSKPLYYRLLALGLLAGSSFAATSIERVTHLCQAELAGRLAGEPGETQAAQFISKELQSAGLVPAFGADFGQNYAFVKSTHFNQARLLVNGAAVDSLDWAPLEASTSAQNLELPLAFCGYGIHNFETGWNDYAGADLSGMAVVIIRQGPVGERAEDDEWIEAYALRSRVAAARKAGAACVLIADNPFESRAGSQRHEGPDPTFGDTGLPLAAISSDLLEELLEETGKSPRSLLSQANRRRRPVGPILLESVISLSLEPLRVTRESVNLLAVPAGQEAGRDWLVIGAHYDHLGAREDGDYFPGADDNASGVAALLQIAESLTREVENLSHNVLFAFFAGEEQGRLGSRYLLNSGLLSPDAISLMINIDMVGHYDRSGLSILGLNDYPELSAGPFPEDGALEFKAEDAAPGGDHESFLARGVPSVMLFTGAQPEYHTPQDVVESLDIEGIDRVVDWATEWLELLRKEKLVLARPGRALTDATERQGRIEAGIGITPAYQATAEGGMRIAAVRAASPAERAGLVAGDQVMAVNQKPVANIFDYTYALRGTASGDTLQVEVLLTGERDTGADGRRLTLPLALENRRK